MTSPLCFSEQPGSLSPLLGIRAASDREWERKACLHRLLQAGPEGGGQRQPDSAQPPTSLPADGQQPPTRVRGQHQFGVKQVFSIGHNVLFLQLHIAQLCAFLSVRYTREFHRWDQFLIDRVAAGIGEGDTCQLSVSFTQHGSDP